MLLRPAVKQRLKIFGCTGWTIFFRDEIIDDGYADITTDLENMVATVRYDSSNKSKDQNPRISAKHEAIHLLLNRLARNGCSRFVTSAEMYESEEELVHKLEGLIT